MKQQLEKQRASPVEQMQAIVLETLASLGLTKVKIEQLVRQPILEAFEGMSEDRKWHMEKIVITNLKPASYKRKVLDGSEKA